MTTKTTAPDFTGDIDRKLAHRAFYSTSQDPEKRGDLFVRQYAEQLQADWVFLGQYVTSEEKRAVLAVTFDTYRKKYAERMRGYLHSHSSLASSFVVGPANFPVARMQKRQRWTENRWNEAQEFRRRAMKGMQELLCPGVRPIMSGDADAVERLIEEVARLEARQVRMLAVNKVCRATKNQSPEARQEAVVETLIEHGYAADKADERAHALLHPRFAYQGEGFPAYTLRNNNANLRRQRHRLEALQRDKAKPVESIEGEIARYQDAPADNRVRLFFPDKPPAELRQRLKRSGFRWAPSIGAWQAYRNPGTVHTAREIAGVNQSLDRVQAVAG